jgi:hypothetical protein
MTSAVLAPEVHTMTTRRAVTPGTYGIVAISIAVIAIMAAPIVLSALASIKTPADASAIPPSYLPRALSFENYAKVFQFQAGLATYVANSALVAAMAVAACLALAAPAGYGLARFAMRGKEIAFTHSSRADHDPLPVDSDPALSGLRQGRPGQHPPLPRNRAYDPATAVLDLPDARQF